MSVKRYTFRWVAVSPDINGGATGRVEVEACDPITAKAIAEATVKHNGSIDWMLEATDNIEIIPSLEREEELF